MGSAARKIANYRYTRGFDFRNGKLYHFAFWERGMRKARKNRTAEILSQPQVFGPIAAAHVQAFCRFAALGIQGCFLLNATVGIAAFAQRTPSIGPIALCAIGAILAVCAAYRAYQAQYWFAREDSAKLRTYMEEDSKLLKIEVKYCNEQGEQKAEACFSACVLSLGLFVLALVVLFVAETGTGQT